MTEVQRVSATVLVAVPTRARPEMLRRCLESLTGLEIPESLEVRLLVVDNDPGGSAAPVVAAHPTVTYVHEPMPGLAEVRNRALDEAAARPEVDAMAFVDDDEVVESDWLSALHATQVETGAGIVTGPVHPMRDSARMSRAKWTYFEPFEHPHGATVKEAWGGNCLITRPWFDGPRAARFDLAYSGAGGEDSEFSRRIARQGCRIVYTPHAVAHHDISDDRVSWRWILTRRIGHGEGWARIALAHGDAGRARLLVLGLLRILKGCVMVLLAPFRARSPLEERSMKALLKGIGFVTVALGWHSQSEHYTARFEPSGH